MEKYTAKQLIDSTVSLVQDLNLDFKTISLLVQLQLNWCSDIDLSGVSVSFKVNKNNVDGIGQVLENSDIIESFEYLGDTVQKENSGWNVVEYANFIAYFTPDQTFDYDLERHQDYDQDDDLINVDILTEALHIAKVNSLGVKTVKIKCQKGFKSEGGICVKISGSELVNLRKGAKKAVLSKRALGAGYAKLIKLKTKRADKWRKLLHVQSGEF
jgi:hypothetical protein